MPRERFLNLAPEARRALLETAAKHFANSGFEAASLNEILGAAGISKGAFYYYFDDKDDLFATTLESAVDTMLEKLPLPPLAKLSKADFWPTVESLIHEWAATFDTSSDLFQAALHLSEEQRRSPRFVQVLARAQVMYRMLIEPGQKLGCVRTDLSVEVLVRLLEANDAMLDTIFLATHTKVTAASLDKHVSLVFDTFKRLLIADPFIARGSSKTRPTKKPTRARRA